MNAQNVTITEHDVRALLGASSGDAALLYIYLKAGNAPENAGPALNMSQTRLSCAEAVLRQMGLVREARKTHVPVGERPNYSEQDVLDAARDTEYESLRGEVMRVLGRPINTEEDKILLGFIRYLGLPVDVISMLVSYCKNRARQRGSLRNPSLRTIEKEAYHWAEQGIDTMEAAAAFIHAQTVRNSRLSRLMNQLQIRGRSLTPAEEKYAQAWLEMGFDEEALAMAYERTCLNTGGMNWNYMNKILQRWHEAGLHTAEAVRNGDRKPGTGGKGSQRQTDADEQAAIKRMLSEV